jgi:hypothetical protein
MQLKNLPKNECFSRLCALRAASTLRDAPAVSPSYPVERYRQQTTPTTQTHLQKQQSSNLHASECRNKRQWRCASCHVVPGVHVHSSHNERGSQIRQRSAVVAAM